MISLLTGWLTGKALPYLVAAAIALAAACLFWAGVAKIDGMVDKARIEAIAARDAYWKAEIATVNAKIEAASAAAARAAMQRDAELADAAKTIADQQALLETTNATLPGGGDCGIGRDRVRLLSHQ